MEVQDMKMTILKITIQDLPTTIYNICLFTR